MENLGREMESIKKWKFILKKKGLFLLQIHQLVRKWRAQSVWMDPVLQHIQGLERLATLSRTASILFSLLPCTPSVGSVHAGNSYGLHVRQVASLSVWN